jgi:hypothetical protein
MTKLRFGAAAIGLSIAALTAVSASAIGSKADCEYEGGQVFNVNGDTVCVVAIRPAEYSDEIYDGQQLGVKECAGEKIGEDQFCKITLVKAPENVSPPAEADVEAAVEEVIEETN